MTTRYPDGYEFNDADYERYKDTSRHFWSCPVRLVKDGTWADLWREDDTTRGGGAATSILPVLAVHTFPEKRDPDTREKNKDPNWTGWAYLTRRRIALLSGVHVDTATRGMQQLKDAGLLEMDNRPRGKYEGGYKTAYRLSRELYPKDDEEWAKIPAALFYSGSWHILPTSAARHLYIVIACLDPIKDETAYLSKIQEDFDGGTPWWDLLYELPEHRIEGYDDTDLDHILKLTYLARERREQEPRSLRELADHSGMHKNTVADALKILTTPVYGGGPKPEKGYRYPPIPLVATTPEEEAEPQKPRWYAPDRRSWSWVWPSDLLNDRERVRRTQRKLWPHLTTRTAEAIREEEERKRRQEEWERQRCTAITNDGHRCRNRAIEGDPQQRCRVHVGR